MGIVDGIYIYIYIVRFQPAKIRDEKNQKFGKANAFWAYAFGSIKWPKIDTVSGTLMKVANWDIIYVYNTDYDGTCIMYPINIIFIDIWDSRKSRCLFF